MKVSLNIIQSLVDFELPPVDVLVGRINAQLGGVEEVIDMGAKYKDALIVRVIECNKHPNADKLSVCKIDTGEKEPVQVVCGAPNVRADMWAVWLPPSSIVPASYDDKEPFVLGARELRGVVSHGMLAAGDELAINGDHDGIVDIQDADIPEGQTLQAGASFAELFGLDDMIIDIENKMFTHRPDCFGHIGVAREIAGILGYQFHSPKWYLDIPKFKNAKSLPLSVFNNAADKTPRFMAVALRNVVIQPSPLWMQCKLVSMNGKVINNIVDATNYIMLMTAQPTHAYDYDKIRGGTIGARMANPGESLPLLNGKTYELDAEDIVIADGDGAIGLAGVMGGGNSEVSAQTKNIIIEVANFDMYSVRKTSMRHGLFTDALVRFNKGQSPLQCDRVMDYLLKNIGGEQASEVADAQNHKSKIMNQEVMVANQFINDRLGLGLDDASIQALLRNVEIDVLIRDSGLLTLTPPFWRTDIEIGEDVIEEVGRLYGFDKLPVQLPARSIRPAPKNLERELKMRLRHIFASLGANEVLNYSFVHERVIKNAGQDVEQVFRLSNALSPDLQYYRLTVLPSLLDKVHLNIKAGHDEFVLYEIGKGHNKKYHAGDDDGLPSELEFVDAVYASKKSHEGAAYYHMREFLSQACKKFGATIVCRPIEEKLVYSVTAPFDLQRSALVETDNGIFIGMVGELKPQIIKQFKLPEYTAAMTLDFGGILEANITQKSIYKPLSRYPSVSQDISLKVSSDTTYSDILHSAEKTLEKAAHGLRYRLSPISIYQPNGDSQSKTITLRLIISDDSSTLTDKKVTVLMDQIASDATEAHSAQRV